MSEDIAISVQNLTKIYKLYDSPQDRLKEALHPFRKRYHRDFYALNDISFEVKKGETVGIIGRNGAGKSTLLKVVTGVITPSNGNVTVNGKISALLELGAGFNPQLTGTENVYFNGTLMGYSKEEMDAKLDDILSFADIGDFVYQPVKTYSSGMFSRLAFAVAINIDPEILIVDEALSVGDFAFQFKCMKKFRQFQEDGKTILFVTHNTQSILQYCSYALYFNNGKLKRQSEDVKGIVYEYEEDMRNNNKPMTTFAKQDDVIPHDFAIEVNNDVDENRFGTHEAIMRKIVLTDQYDSWDDSTVLFAGDEVFIKILVLSKRSFDKVVMGVTLKNKDGIDIWGDNTPYALGDSFSLKKGRNIITFSFNLLLNAGEYMLFAGLADVFSAKRIELDQRWPCKKIVVRSSRQLLGCVFAPSHVTIEN